MNKIKALILAACSIPTLSYATDYQWLTFQLTDDTEMSVASEGLAMSYNAGMLHLKSATVDQSLETQLIKSMKFTTIPAGVEGVKDVVASEAEYFDASGKKMGIFQSLEEARKSLPSGTYIIRGKDKTIKVIF